MKKFLFTALLTVLVLGCKEKVKEAQENASEIIAKTEKELLENEWEVLFDGKSFDGWHEYNKEGISEYWKIEDGAMIFYPPENRDNSGYFHLVSDNEYTDFTLSIEWRVSEAGNSGIFWGVKEIPELVHPHETGPEIQVLDNDRHPDGKNGTNHTAGALYDMVSPSKDATKVVGEWNVCEITINHKINKGFAVLNGEKVSEFPLHNEAWDAMVVKSKFAGWQHFAKYQTGKIGLQDHDDIVAFRNIKIKRL